MPETTKPAEGQYTLYKIQPGDTLNKIAAKFGMGENGASLLQFLNASPIYIKVILNLPAHDFLPLGIYPDDRLDDPEMGYDLVGKTIIVVEAPTNYSINVKVDPVTGNYSYPVEPTSPVKKYSLPPSNINLVDEFFKYYGYAPKGKNKANQYGDLRDEMLDSIARLVKYSPTYSHLFKGKSDTEVRDWYLRKYGSGEISYHELVEIAVDVSKNAETALNSDKVIFSDDNKIAYVMGDGERRISMMAIERNGEMWWIDITTNKFISRVASAQDAEKAGMGIVTGVVGTDGFLHSIYFNADSAWSAENREVDAVYARQTGEKGTDYLLADDLTQIREEAKNWNFPVEKALIDELNRQILNMPNGAELGLDAVPVRVRFQLFMSAATESYNARMNIAKFLTDAEQAVDRNIKDHTYPFKGLSVAGGVLAMMSLIAALASIALPPLAPVLVPAAALLGDAASAALFGDAWMRFAYTGDPTELIAAYGSTIAFWAALEGLGAFGRFVRRKLGELLQNTSILSASIQLEISSPYRITSYILVKDEISTSMAVKIRKMPGAADYAGLLGSNAANETVSKFTLLIISDEELESIFRGDKIFNRTSLERALGKQPDFVNFGVLTEWVKNPSSKGQVTNLYQEGLNILSDLSDPASDTSKALLSRLKDKVSIDDVKAWRNYYVWVFIDNPSNASAPLRALQMQRIIELLEKHVR